tara:strand:+ start:687 stop:1235 length:549 start_codon:yes stop_codon:yes gene_type:complete
MKILYTDMHVLDSGHQIKAYPATVGAEAKTNTEKDIESRVSDIQTSVKNMYSTWPDMEGVEPPALGDVIWTQTSGNVWYATCIIYDENGKLNWEAAILCIKSLGKKCVELDQQEVGMTLFGSEEREDLPQWDDMQDVIEHYLEEYAQVVAYVPDIVYLSDVVSSLPGTVDKIVRKKDPNIIH